MVKRVVNGLYSFLTLLLALLVINHFTATVEVPPAVTFGVLILAALLFFVRLWMKRGY